MAACASCGHEASAPFRFCPECGAEQTVHTASHEQRRTVTVVFCDLAGSTALGESLDPERMRALLAQYFERMKSIVERHGGSVEKFIGDAVMAVFGVPVAHEDDALRAVRAAVEMRDALPELVLEGRIGVMTGEVVTGTEERLATGDAVNVAARLEQAARPGEVLIGEPTLTLVHGAVEAHAVVPLQVKGKAEPVRAYRLHRVLGAPERRHDASFVGRDRELALLRGAWELARSGQCCELVTVVGDAGVGKSRLVAELVASVDARVAQGRCLPYGEGITYWPVVEVVKQLDLLPPEEAAAAAIRSLLGQSDGASSAEEIAWAFRKTLEHAAAARPLLVVFDDIQWGEETFRDLIEHIALLSAGAAILLVCIARPELTERRPTWPVTLRLEPLGDDDVDRLIPQGLDDQLRTKIAHAAGGNPLFVLEMLVMTGETDGEIVVPPTLHALLTARLDQLEPAERSVLEHGAIEGEIFHRGAVQALGQAEESVTPVLAALVRKQLIRRETPQLAGEDGFRFRHLLLRDAAYDGLPKATRAVLHQRFATWLEQDGSALVELDELVGYHLERAYTYRSELGLPDDHPLAMAARRRLMAAGQRAARRQDYKAAVNLFERAAAFVPTSEIDVVLETELGVVLDWTGRTKDALPRADALADRAAAAGNRVGELCMRIQAGVLRLISPEGTESTDASETLAVLVEQALPEFEAAGDELALFVGYNALGEVAIARGRFDAAVAAYEQALVHARRGSHEPSSMLSTLAWCRFNGTTTVTELLAWLDENEPHGGRDQFFRAYRAWSLARLARFDEARAILVAARAQQTERGGGLLLANLTAFESVSVELLAGDPAAAAEFGVEGCKLLEELGQQHLLSAAAGVVGQAKYELDLLDEADAWAKRSEELGDSDNVWAQTAWRQVQAKVLARRGEHDEGERTAREAVEISDATDLLDSQGEAYADLAEVLMLAGRRDEAVPALEQALERYERKENLVMAQRVRTRLDELRDAAPR